MSVEEIIKSSLTGLVSLLTNNESGEKLIFPKYRYKTVRYSEQELRQFFLKHVEKDSNYFYSIETPTKYVYCISNSEKPIVKENHETDDGYKSASWDVTLYTENKIESLASCIEFKHSNPDEKSGICKDFLKLAKEVKFTKEKKNCFVHYHYVESENGWESTSFESIFGKYRNSVDYIENLLENKDDLAKVIVYLVCMQGKSKKNLNIPFFACRLKKLQSRNKIQRHYRKIMAQRKNI